MAPIWFWREFETPYGFLSQWYSCNFIHDGQEFTSAEQWMMWSKAKLFDDEESAKKILATDDTLQQQQLGRKVQNYNNAKWDENKFEIVVAGNRLKFNQGVDPDGTPLKQLLLVTENRELVEASPHDKIWGIGFNENDAKTRDRRYWGENLLGMAITQVRKELRTAEEAER